MMQTPGDTFLRLVAALEVLLAEEQCVVRSGEVEKIRAVQQRTDPVITRLRELQDDPAVAVGESRPRLAALQALHVSSMGMMNARLAEMRATLTALQSARSRLGRLGHAYGQKPMAAQSAAAHLSLSA
jgi:hypothetical protein